ncbi:MerC domain-containing protein [Pseudoalteromonas sp. MMG022]|uniref:MerC domain-containing protein n=1 Tax=Pseudoalteromonas sp. MMG022 TaxID=2909978 RepID=UPI001F2DC042|nr:MerC domain-containing protein [Pseudoalteromonas sp. MMG022]MCF6434604.1 MerC domain-containing protein [Pseudoalteromonas sp. MMG022]
MRTTQRVTDKFAVGLSVMCSIHCLLLPILLSLLPSLTALPLGNEAFHIWMIVAVLPSSLFALTLGCKQHQDYRLLLIGGMGLIMLVAALFSNNIHLGEVGEKVLTLLGSILVATAHLRNYRLCHASKSHDCPCPDTQ